MTMKLSMRPNSVFRVCILLVVFLGSLTSSFLFRESGRSQQGQRLGFHMASDMQWTALEPGNFSKCAVDGRQFAKDENYLRAVQEVWSTGGNDIPLEKAPFVYVDSSETSLYGHLVRRREKSDDSSKLPGILLFHTGAGPQDVYLFYKAYQLAQEFDAVIMICDILSDETGWGWDPDRSKYNDVYQSLLTDNSSLLKSRSLAAAEALRARVSQVDCSRIAVIGWCLGGKPVLELGLAPSQSFSILAMSSFHGVFHRKEEPETNLDAKGVAEICMFNGQDDPFVSQGDLDSAREQLEAVGHTVKITQFPHAKHGFSNPAQAWNDSPSFNYNEPAAQKGWEETISLLRRRLTGST